LPALRVLQECDFTGVLDPNVDISVEEYRITDLYGVETSGVKSPHDVMLKIDGYACSPEKGLEVLIRSSSNIIGQTVIPNMKPVKGFVFGIIVGRNVPVLVVYYESKSLSWSPQTTVLKMS